MLTALAFLVAQPAPRVETFTVEGTKREALVFAGEGQAPKGGRPLILAFHGHGGNMNHSARSFGVQRTWPEATVIYPQGLPTKGMTDPEGRKNGWQQNSGQENDRDLKFVDAILAKHPEVDRKRIFSMGHSNGGRFTYILWAKRPQIFAAYGPSGSPAIGMLRDLKPASAFCTAGEKDPIVPFRGQKWSIDAIARLIGADPAKAKVDGYVRLTPGRNGLELGTYIHPGGHEYPSQAATATVEFFKRHSK